jgi:mannitol/fructose-specific phosphotransferase system IIA component (Ntr-type)
MLLREVFDPRCIKVNLEAKTRVEVFGELIETIAAVHPELDRTTMFETISTRENKMTTSVIPGVAIPHGCYPGISDVIGAIGISQTGVEFDIPEHNPVYLVFLFLMGEKSPENHLDVLSKVFAVLKSGAFKHIQKAKSSVTVN